jgi:hypothetical protein
LNVRNRRSAPDDADRQEANMKEDKEIELDCSKNCKSAAQACEASGRSRDECENRYNDCVSRCTFA